jgi:hypothetical protein
MFSTNLQPNSTQKQWDEIKNSTTRNRRNAYQQGKTKKNQWKEQIKKKKQNYKK